MRPSSSKLLIFKSCLSLIFLDDSMKSVLIINKLGSWVRLILASVFVEVELIFVFVEVDSVKIFLLKYGKDAKGISMLTNAN